MFRNKSHDAMLIKTRQKNVFCENFHNVDFFLVTTNCLLQQDVVFHLISTQRLNTVLKVLKVKFLM